MTRHRRLLASGAPLLPESRAWRAAVNAAGGSVSGARLRLIDRLIRALKAGGAWDALDRLWIFAAENAAAALIDLMAQSAATAVNSPTFTADRGFTGNGTSSYLDTNLSATAAGLKFARDSACFGGWMGAQQSGTAFDFGWDYGAYSMIVTRYGANTVRCEVNAGTNPSGTPAISGHTGLFSADRSTSVLTTLYRNGVAEMTSNAPSTALQNRKFGVGAYVGGPANFSSGRWASAHIGRSLGDGGQVRFHAALRGYMTAIGVA